MAEAYIRTKVEFDGARGAALVLHRPQTLYVDPQLIKRIEEDDACITLLKRKLLITDVYLSSSYAMYLSAKRKTSYPVPQLEQNWLTLLFRCFRGGDCGDFSVGKCPRAPRPLSVCRWSNERKVVVYIALGNFRARSTTPRPLLSPIHPQAAKMEGQTRPQ